jgi:amino acid adenylation domain-containing protein
MGMKNIEDFYPLSPMQQGLLFHSLAEPKSDAYFEQSSYTLRGNLNIAAFDYAWQQVLNRYSILRTCFVWEGLKEPIQLVHRQVKLPFLHHDWRHLSSIQQQEQIEVLLQSDRSQGFDLKVAPLMRLVLIQLADNHYHFTWSHHHLLLDGWSVPLIFQEVLAFYKAFGKGQALSIASVRPYRDYILWLQQQNLSAAEAYWRQLLKGFSAPTKLCRNQKYQQILNDGYGEQALRLTAETTAKLRSLAQKHQLTVNTVVQGAWALLLNRYSSEKDVVFGAVVSGRPSALLKAESMIGLFINTLPVRVQVNPEAFLLPWLKQIQLQQVETRQYEYTPLVEIQGWSEVSRGLPLFESIVAFENFPIEEISASEPGLGLEIKNYSHFQKTNYPLTLSATPGKELLLEIEYDRGEGFDAALIQRLLEHLETLLKAMVVNPQQHLKELSLLTAAEQHQLLVEWNNTQAEYPKDQCLHELFEATVEHTPDAVAVVFDNQQLTYRELNTKANQLAKYLQKLGVTPEVLVGIYLERSLSMAIAILATLKAGGAYIPLDPTYPRDRLSGMVEDSQVKVLLTQQQLIIELPETQADVVYLDQDWDLIAQEQPDNCSSAVTPENLAYIIYTSGSTGKPKGAMVAHQALVNYALEIAKQFKLKIGDRVLQFASVGFDVVVEELFPTWLSGATVVLLESKQPISGTELLQLIHKHQLTVFELPTAYWHQWVYELSQTQTPLPTCVRLIIIGGETVSPQQLAAWQKFGSDLVHVYGLTETTVTSTLYHLASGVYPQQLNNSNLPIGRPIANTQIYILDEALQPVPVGVVGELYIGGVGLGRGYLNRGDITAQRFIPHPFSDKGGERLYKTGDLARYLADGNIKCLGRIDHQVKFRGFRIEPGEIEAAINQHPAVCASVVVLREDEPGNKTLVAYITLDAQQQLTSIELRRFLEPNLPSYMLPTAIVMLETLPLTPNGKVDRQALPVPDLTQLIPQSNFVAASTPVEQMLAGIWKQVLGIEKLGVHDNFFDLGGHSLLATRLISRVRQVFGLELPLRSLFEEPTVAGLAKYIKTTLNPTRQQKIEPVSREEKLPLSFAQTRLWFLAQLEPDSSDYNIPAPVRLLGNLDIVALEQCFNEVVQRHEILRTSFITVDGEPIQVIAPSLQLNLSIIDLQRLPATEQNNKIQELITEEALKPFDLSKIPLFRMKLLRLSEAEHILILILHHIIFDMWSVEVLLQEVKVIYENLTTGKSSPLPDLPIQYADFAVWQRQYLKNEVLENHLNYWKQQLSGTLPVLHLPTNRPRSAVTYNHGAIHDFALPKDLSDAIQAFSQQEGVTLYMTLLAALNALLYTYNQQEDILIGSPIANRNQVDLEPLIGFFVNTIILRTNLSGNPSFRDLLVRVRELTLGAYAHQELPFEKLVEALQPNRKHGEFPLVQVWFVLENALLTEMKLADVNLIDMEFYNGIANYELRLSISETSDGLKGSLDYKSELFAATTIVEMVKNLEIILRQVVDKPDISLNELAAMITQSEQLQQITQQKELAQTSLQKLQRIKRKVIDGSNN